MTTTVYNLVQNGQWWIIYNATASREVGWFRRIEDARTVNRLLETGKDADALDAKLNSVLAKLDIIIAGQNGGGVSHDDMLSLINIELRMRNQAMKLAALDEKTEP